MPDADQETPVEDRDIPADTDTRAESDEHRSDDGTDGESTPAPVPDETLIAAVELAREALQEITPASTVGEPAGHVVVDDHVVSLLFANTMAGYPGWFWTVTLSRTADDAAPNVLETELMPGDGALLAPQWVPWSERLADYRAAQEAAAAAAADDALDDADDTDEFDDDVALSGDPRDRDRDGIELEYDEDDVDAASDDSDEDEDDSDDDDSDEDDDRFEDE